MRVASIDDLPPFLRAQAARRLSDQGSAGKPAPAAPAHPRTSSMAGESQISSLMAALIAQVVDPAIVEREACLVPGRDWRCDYVIRPHRIVVEVEGLLGGAQVGRHQTVAGMSADAEKYNELVILGWRVLRFTGRQIRREGDLIVDQLRRAIGNGA